MNNNAFTVKEFCASFRVGKTKLYSLWATGTGPAIFKIGRGTRISTEAAETWRKNQESIAAAARAGA